MASACAPASAISGTNTASSRCGVSYAAGPHFGNQTQNEIDWWIFWGRLAGGLNRNQQADIVQRLLPLLVPRPGKKTQRINNSLLREMWRTASSMELIPPVNRIQLGDALLKESKEDYVLWCLSRLGARQLFYGPANQVLAPSVAARWTEALLTVPKADDALVSLARRTGDPVRDVSTATFAAVRARLTDPQLIAQLEGEAERDERALGRIYGEGLPQASSSVLHEGSHSQSRGGRFQTSARNRPDSETTTRPRPSAAAGARLRSLPDRLAYRRR